ncbi:VOC family protein [Erythrobacteraceae bacterium E2-1 Yellow Sea]|nr:VOC family protein [Erythrobacteraceae bacterium E2-1 Yellow Sea]
MAIASLEHVNLTVTDLDRCVKFFQELCGWHVRWRGTAMMGGETVHIGTDTAYLAIYTNPAASGGHGKGRPLNHIGLLVDDLSAAEEVVTRFGFKTWGHEDYEPGRRFYFYDWDGIEYEVVSYE